MYSLVFFGLSSLNSRHCHIHFTPEELSQHAAPQMQQMALVMQKQMHMQHQGGAGPPVGSSGVPPSVMQQHLQGQLVLLCCSGTSHVKAMRLS